MSSDNERRYFYADGPSPLHEARAKYVADRRESAEKAEALAKEIGALSCAGRGRVEGFAFAEKPDESKWRFVARDNKGNSIFAPKRNHKAGKELHARMVAIKFPSSESVLKGTGLDIMRVHGRYMLRSAAGWAGDRVFVTIPCVGIGDAFPEVPEYLTPCKRWEMEKFIDELKATSEAPSEH